MKEVSGIPNGWAGVKPINSDQYSLLARRPRDPAISTDKIKRVFGIGMASWEEQLRSCMAELVNSGEQDLRAKTL